MAFLAGALALALTSTTAMAWGPTGHRVSGAIADRFICGTTRLEIRDLLGVETLADAANWADYMRMQSDSYWSKTTFNWHFVTIPDGKTYRQAGVPPEGDAISALAKFRALVLDRTAPVAARSDALRMIVHIVGDLGQPLHSGNAHDRGGNDEIVTLRGQQTNLHTIWDSTLIDGEQMSYAEWADYLLARVTSKQAIAWSSPDPEAWVEEARALHPRVYPKSKIIDGDYLYNARPLLHAQMTKSGLHLAAYLNDMFGHCGG
ncbi:S1/P1 nuclease [Sphingomonas sp. TDK1]|uniref:S1/P1 nuclease n=1 Tax=Sphingomonas sp. TDK1 TaxID=453247 RepID=UPI0018DC9230|nr:S1/P1 nuclease [Sphingomonas sp. TDK1]